jgi:hypothetical protein
MKRLALLVVASLAITLAAFAHEGNEHVRGVVTEISARSITVQVGKTTRTLKLSDKTTYKQGGKAAHFADLKVGDRVVIDVPEHSKDASEIQIAAAKE